MENDMPSPGPGPLQFGSGSLRSWERLGLDSPFGQNGPVAHDFMRADGSVDSVGKMSFGMGGTNAPNFVAGSAHMKSRDTATMFADDAPPLFDNWLHEMVADDPELLQNASGLGSGSLSLSRLIASGSASGKLSARGSVDTRAPFDNTEYSLPLGTPRFDTTTDPSHVYYQQQQQQRAPLTASPQQAVPRSKSGRVSVGVRPTNVDESSAYPYTPQAAHAHAQTQQHPYTYEQYGTKPQQRQQAQQQQQKHQQQQQSPVKQSVPRHPLLAPASASYATANAANYAPSSTYYTQVNAPAVILPSVTDPTQPAFQYTYETAWAAPSLAAYSGDRSREVRTFGPPKLEHLGSRGASIKELILFDDRSTTTGGRTAPTVSSYDSYETGTTGTGGSTKSIRKRKYKRSAAAKFCHICLRKESAVQLAVCGNILTSTCLKVICEVCFKTYGWDWAEATAEDSNWTCTHCRDECPDKSRCKTYQKKNKDTRSDNKRSSGVGSFSRKSGGGASVLKKISELPILQGLQK